MSINQVADNFSGNRNWVDIRVNDLNILSDLNIDTTSANIGDELVIGSGGELQWQSSADINFAGLDSMVITFRNQDIQTQFPFALLIQTPIILPPTNFTYLGNGVFNLSTRGVYLFFASINVMLTNNLQLCSIGLEKSFDNQPFRTELQSLDVSNNPGAASGIQSLTAYCPIIIPNSGNTNLFRLTGNLISSSSPTIPVIGDTSTLTIIKIG